MPSDRFVYWTSERPSREEFAQVMANYFGGVGEISVGHGRFFIELPGTPTNALSSLISFGNTADSRVIEVYVDDDSIDIMTRHCDEFTSALADGLMLVFVGYWQATVDEDFESIVKAKLTMSTRKSRLELVWRRFKRDCTSLAHGRFHRKKPVWFGSSRATSIRN